jgi:uncharacterized protein YabE (DUF348 family)
LPLGAFAGLCLGLILLYQASAIPVSLTVDGADHVLQTHAGTVGDLLEEQDVVVAVQDQVVPVAGSRLRAGMHVVVRHARPVRVRADGREISVRSPYRSPMAILGQVGIALQPADAVKLNGRLWPRRSGSTRPLARLDGPVGMPTVRPAPPVQLRLSAQERPAGEGPPRDGGLPPDEWTVDVLRAVALTIVEDDIPYTFQAAGATVGEALQAAGFAFVPEDELQPPADAPLSGPMVVTVRRALPFTVAVDGRTDAVRAHAATVGQALERVGIWLLGRDYAVPPVDAPLARGLHIDVVRVVEEIVEREVAIPPGRVTQPAPAMVLDERHILQPGQAGLKRERIRVIYENGEVASREVVEVTVLQEPVAEIVAYGTHVVWRTVDTEQGPKPYWRKLRMYATSYSPARSGTPRSAPWYGRSRMGLEMRKGIVGVDPDVIPLGMWLYIPGYGVAIAGDTGGGIRPYLVDLGYADDDYQSWHSYVDVYILDRLPPEHQMPWILPDGQPTR